MLFILSLLPVGVALGQVVVGGLKDVRVSPSDERVVFAFNAINEQFLKDGGSSADSGLELVEIVRARLQVVSGELLYLTLHVRAGQSYGHCNVTVWSRPWLRDSERLQILADPTCHKVRAASPQLALRGGLGRQGIAGVPGGISDAKPLPEPGQGDVAGVHDALNFAACAANDQVNSAQALVLAHTGGVTYTQQVTAGTTFRFYNVPMAPTTCSNQGCFSLNPAACPPALGAKEKKCDFQVQSQPWQSPQYRLTKATC